MTNEEIFDRLSNTPAASFALLLQIEPEHVGPFHFPPHLLDGPDRAKGLDDLMRANARSPYPEPSLPAAVADRLAAEETALVADITEEAAARESDPELRNALESMARQYRERAARLRAKAPADPAPQARPTATARPARARAPRAKRAAKAVAMTAASDDGGTAPPSGSDPPSDPVPPETRALIVATAKAIAAEIVKALRAPNLAANAPDDGALLTLEDAAAEIGVNERTLRGWAAGGSFPVVRFGRKCVRVRRSDLDRFKRGGRR
jgi:excisionase family DNA binding protein